MKPILLLQAILSIEQTPQLEIKNYKGAEFGAISSVTTMTDGNIVIVDRGYSTLYFFDTKGKPINTIGAEGAGPGEFKLPIVMGECRENVLYIRDPNNARITEVSSSGKILNIQLSQNVFATAPYKVSCNKVGQLLTINPAASYYTPKIVEGPYRDSASVYIQVNKSNKIKVGDFLGDERYLWIIRKDMLTGAPRPKGKTLLTTINNNIFVGSADSFYVEIFNLAGQKIGSINHKVPLKKITNKDREKFVYEEALDRKIPTAVAERMFGTALPTTLPPYERFIGNKDKLWIQLSRNGTDTNIQWFGFNSAGKLFATLTVPNSFEIFEFHDNSVLGIWTDIEIAESVRHYRLRVKL